ncbi:7TM diverse intracellular signaling domain-containing protein [Synoicihabitans lomoniglobus]|uniref:7TM diverse intracellular signaling domain-containing protein n=1 Tax=Synoicihabitans lomoniglobus TaxID=2909285 RepID=UPI002ED6520A|nr:7TM-DISM domain-containing protein [Opitutaceae bacterium LMO-M01]
MALTADTLPVWTVPTTVGEFGASYAGNWQHLTSIENPVAMAEPWSGHGALRLKLDTSQLVTSEILFLQVSQAGGTEIRLNGELLGWAGRPGGSPRDEIAVLRNAEPLPLRLQPGEDGILELRHSNHEAVNWSGVPNLNLDLHIRLISPSQWEEETRGWNDTIRAPLLFFIAVPGMLALLHLALAILKIEPRPNLAAGCFMLSLAVLSATRLALASAVDLGSYGLAHHLFLAVIPLFSVLGLQTVYGLLRQPQGTLYRVLQVCGWLVIPVVGWWGDAMAFKLAAGYGIVCSIELLRVATHAVRARRQGAILLFSGMACFAVVIVYNALRVLEVVPPEVWSTHSMNFGVLVLAFMLSLHVARDYALTSRRLAVKVVEVEKLGKANVQREREKQFLLPNKTCAWRPRYLSAPRNCGMRKGNPIVCSPIYSRRKSLTN